MDQIQIHGLKVFAYHGVNPEEKRDGQNFVLDITADVDLSVPCRSDRVEDTVSYAKMIKTVIRVVQEASYDLLERVSQRVADQLLEEYPRIQSVEVTLKKPEAPIKAEFDDVAVHIVRRREG